MKNRKKTLVSCCLAFLLLLNGCNDSSQTLSLSSQNSQTGNENNSSETSSVAVSSEATSLGDDSKTTSLQVYTIRWENYNGDLLEIDDNVLEGTIPKYDGDTPVRPSDDYYNYIWIGWSPEIAPVVSDQIYVASFSSEKKKIEYTIDFDLCGGFSASYQGPKIVENITKETFFFDCEKEGYNFRGWSYKGEKVFDEKGNQIGAFSFERTMIFTALYSQTVMMTIITNIENAGIVSGEGEYVYNSYVDVSVIPLKGYSFVGWFFEGILLSETVNYKYMMWNKDVTLEARFAFDNFLISIQTNNDNYGLVLLKTDTEPNRKYDTHYEEYRKYKSEITVAAYSKTDTRFLGWYDLNNKLVETNGVFTFTMPNDDFRLIAKWNHFNITYNLNGGINNLNNITSFSIDYGEISFYKPVKEGYVFLGWRLNGEYVESVNSTIADDLYLEAMWETQNFTVTYNLNGGINHPDNPDSFTIETETILLKDPSQVGFEFAGWYCDDSFKDPIKSINKGTAKNIILYAKWIYGINPIVDFENGSITYGVYPQTHVSDSDLISCLNELEPTNNNGWYLYKNIYYTKIDTSHHSFISKFDDGTIIQNKETYWFKCEPIKWNILSINGNYCVLLSNILLDAIEFQEYFYDGDGYRNNYKNSFVRKWLNNVFYQTAFYGNTSHIVNATVDNSLKTTDQTYNIYVCENTLDNVTLLSYQDYINSNYGFQDNDESTNSRCCQTSEWARANWASYGDNFNGNYWTRSPCSFSGSSTWIVNSLGELKNFDVHSYHQNICVRPSIVFNGSKFITK